MDNTGSEQEYLEHILNDSSAEPTKLSYSLMRSITANFSREIGRGGFGVVYMGNLRNGRVAVKMISNAYVVSDKQFLDEIKCLIRAKHRNIVRFLGYCSHTQGEVMEYNGAYVMAEEQKRLLCFEYVPNGNIQQYLQEKPQWDDWHKRYKMIKGIFYGLRYLHDHRISHLDLKLENVMLDANIEAKITDFGLSRCLDEGKSIIFTEIIRGTKGYMAPEIINDGEISIKCDICALGIIIIKLLTRRNTIDFDIWDQSLHMDSLQVKSCIEIAQCCIQTDQHKRPTMGGIIHKLHEMESMIQGSTNDKWSSIYQVSKIQGSASNTLSSINQVRYPFPKTELLDVYPLELRVPMTGDVYRRVESDLPNRCSLGITNNTDREVGFAIMDRSKYVYMDNNIFSGILKPMSTISISHYNYLKSNGWIRSREINMFIMRSNDDVRELMSEFFQYTSIDYLRDGGHSSNQIIHKLKDLPKEVEESYRTYITTDKNISSHELMNALKAVEMGGGQVHRAMLTSVEYDPASNPTMYRFMDMRGGSNDEINHIHVHPTEPWVLTVDSNWTIQIWNWETEELLGPTNIVFRFFHYCRPKFIAEKQWLVTAGDPSGHITVLTCPKLKIVKQFMGHRDCIRHLAVHPTRPLVVSCSRGSMKVWDWKNDWSCIQIFEGHYTSPVVQLNFKDTETFATLGEDDIVKIWNVRYTKHINTLEPLDGARLEFVFSRSDDQSHMITAISSLSMRIWDLKKDEHVHTFSLHELDFSVHELDVDKLAGQHIVVVCCHPTRPLIAVASKDSTIHVWDTTTYRLKTTMNVRRWPRYISLVGSRRSRKEYMVLENEPIGITFIGTRSLMVGYKEGVAILDIDVEYNIPIETGSPGTNT